MKKRIQGLVAGLLIGCAISSSIACAKSGIEWIPAYYNSIKFYIDGKEIQLQDSFGNNVEPLIYNGTTYVPIDAIGKVSGKPVVWDGATQSIFCGNKPGEIKYLIDACPPYTGSSIEKYSQNNGEYFTMAGNKFSNGFVFTHTFGAYALCNLNGQYEKMSLTLGSVPKTYSTENQCDVMFIVDNNTVARYTVSHDTVPMKVTIPLNRGLQLKICTSDNVDLQIGFADITLE